MSTEVVELLTAGKQQHAKALENLREIVAWHEEKIAGLDAALQGFPVIAEKMDVPAASTVELSSARRRRGERKQQALKVVQEAGYAMRAHEIAVVVGMTEPTRSQVESLRVNLNRLVSEGTLRMAGRGLYAEPGRAKAKAK
ncbi:hypothetical protein [Streptomyces sp. C36]|uniref:hypothetical protein n=1 Tax=Streptomyces sp. C36 TaxID=3237122 RepID=UPI0034C5C093